MEVSESPPIRFGNYKQTYTWTVGSLQARDFLASILHHLIIKCSQAQLAIVFMDKKRYMTKDNRTEELSWRHTIRNAMKTLKRLDVSYVDTNPQ